MKINIIIPGIGLSGGIRVLFRYGELLKKKGHNVIYYTPILAYDVHNNSSILLNKLHVFTNTGKRIYSYCIKRNQKKTGYEIQVLPIPIIADCFVRDADIVMASAWPTAFSVLKLNEKKGKKVYFIQDYEVWNNKELGMKSYTLPLKHIVISTWIKNQIAAQLNGSRASIVYDGVDLETFNNVKTHYYDGNSEFTILMLYHSLSKKGVEDGMAAYKKIKKAYNAVRLVMFGLDRNPMIPKDVKYYYNPTREQLCELYRKADVYLYPSREEGWGLTPLEAMASGCPVVGTKTGCMLDIGENRKNALLSEPRDIEGLVSNIEEIIIKPELSRKLAINAYECVQQFSWNNAITKFELILKDICNEN